MNRPGHPWLHLTLALLIAVSPLQGVFAAVVAAPDAGGAEHRAAVASMTEHHHHAAGSVAASGDSVDTVCECCPDGMSGSCGNCAVTPCSTGHCAAAAVMPADVFNPVLDLSIPVSDRLSASLPPSLLSLPYRPPRA